MSMKRVVPILSLLLLLAFGLKAQNYKVLSMEHMPKDMTARDEMRTDDNERKCAVIKIVTQNITPEARSGFYFESDWGSQVVHRDIKGGEIRVWVSPGLKTLIIRNEELGSWELQIPSYGLTVEPLHTYKVMIQGTMVVGSYDAKPVTTQQFLAFQITPPNAVLEVNDELWNVDADGNAQKYVRFGSYSYKVRAANYFTKEGKVIVNDPDKTVIEKVTLVPNFTEVTLTVDADAEIWVNNEKKGVRTWKGALGNDTYRIECRMADHEPGVTTVMITPDKAGQTIALTAPKPIYGTLLVESTPSFCKLYIDGKEIGTTPKSINEILVGQHKIKLTKDGYADYFETVNINKGEPKQVNVQLSKAVSHNNKKNAPVGAIGGKFSVSDKKKVYFSQGNLQYQASTKTWRFAEHQWDVIGEANKNISSSYSGWIDLFGWGTSGYKEMDPYMTEITRNSDIMDEIDLDSDLTLNIAGTKFDWGFYNAISNGGKKRKTWRTLTKDEWDYVFNKRITTSGIRYAMACVNNVNGVILLPDDWNTNTYSLKSTDTPKADFTTNTITASQWTTLEAGGAVFLPAAGSWDDSYGIYNSSSGHYWSATCYGGLDVYHVFFRASSLELTDAYIGSLSVRLVRNAR